MAKDKVYVPMSSAKQITFADGGSLMKLGFKAADLITFINAHQNERGWINLVVSPRRAVGERGDTHSVTLDTYEPKAKSGQTDDDSIHF